MARSTGRIPNCADGREIQLRAAADATRVPRCRRLDFSERPGVWAGATRAARWARSDIAARRSRLSPAVNRHAAFRPMVSHKMARERGRSATLAPGDRGAIDEATPKRCAQRSGACWPVDQRPACSAGGGRAIYRVVLKVAGLAPPLALPLFACRSSRRGARRLAALA